jgi:hypothetical protein
MDRMYDERYGDIHFEEEDPQSIFYNPKCCRNVYLDLVNGVFDEEPTNDDIYQDYDDNDDNEEEEEEIDEEDAEAYYEADNEFDDY